MLYIVVISYQQPSHPMSYDDALELCLRTRDSGVCCHIEHYNL